MKNFRPTAIPLITVDPYFSIWSFSDKLYDDVTRHWTGRRCAMTGLLKSDDKLYRFMGKVQFDNSVYYNELPVIEQKNVKVDATKTTYTFENEILTLELIFRTPLLMNDLMLLSRPVSYISYNIRFRDGKKHNSSIYFDICTETCVNDIAESVNILRDELYIGCGKGNRDVLSTAGDEVMIDWGNLYLSSPDSTYCISDCKIKRDSLHHGLKPENTEEILKSPVKVCSEFPSIGLVKEYKNVSSVSDFLCVAYDDVYSIEYFGEKLKAYWKKDGDSINNVIEKAIKEYDEINKRCDDFDNSLTGEATKISLEYADIVNLVYRQAIASHKLVMKDEKLLFLSKECGSNGCIGTVDVTFPSMPLFLKYNPDLLEGMLNPVFEYATGNHGWIYEFAPHDVGTYPCANGQVYGYVPKTRTMEYNMQMPVEECSNMLICVAALCKARNDYSFVYPHKEILTKWADYLVKAGYDPESQLCTDDFSGHLAHNCNLSIKSVIAIAAWGQMLALLGENGALYTDKAREYAKKWKEHAKNEKCYSLIFDKPDTWSIKYNIVWDKLLNLNMFDEDISKTETEYYKTQIKQYGLPLDSRGDCSKSDWQMWSVCMTDDKEYRQMIIKCMWDFIGNVKERVPFTDYYYVTDPKMAWSFKNRSVQGGLFLPLL